MKEPKFVVTYGATKGSKQVTFLGLSKVGGPEFLEMIDREFKGQEWMILPGSGYCMVTTGKDFEVKPL